MDQPQVVITASELIGIVIITILVFGFVGYAILGGFFSWAIRATETKDATKDQKPKKKYGAVQPAQSGKHYNHDKTE